MQVQAAAPASTSAQDLASTCLVTLPKQTVPIAEFLRGAPFTISSSDGMRPLPYLGQEPAAADQQPRGLRVGSAAAESSGSFSKIRGCRNQVDHASQAMAARNDLAQ